MEVTVSNTAPGQNAIGSCKIRNLNQLDLPAEAFVIEPNVYYKLDITTEEEQTDKTSFTFQLLDDPYGDDDVFRGLECDHDEHDDFYVPMLIVESGEEYQRAKEPGRVLEFCGRHNELTFRIAGGSLGCDCDIFWLRVIYYNEEDDEIEREDLPFLLRHHANTLDKRLRDCRLTDQ
jgi:hypothetical protein